MAKLERSIQDDFGFDFWYNRIVRGIVDGSVSASLEEHSDFRSGEARCAICAFERYSFSGGNRVSLTVTLFQNGDGPIHLSAIATGGSQATFFKVNTWGEEAFLDKLRDLLVLTPAEIGELKYGSERRSF